MSMNRSRPRGPMTGRVIDLEEGPRIIVTRLRNPMGNKTVCVEFHDVKHLPEDQGGAEYHALVTFWMLTDELAREVRDALDDCVPGKL